MRRPHELDHMSDTGQDFNLVIPPEVWSLMEDGNEHPIIFRIRDGFSEWRVDGKVVAVSDPAASLCAVCGHCGGKMAPRQLADYCVDCGLGPEATDLADHGDRTAQAVSGDGAEP